MPKLPNTEQLATEFCRILNDWLDAETLAEVNLRNSLSDNEHTCATHDFCDANQAMIDALQTFGLDFDQAEFSLVNAAWDLAKSRRFTVAEIDE